MNTNLINLVFFTSKIYPAHPQCSSFHGPCTSSRTPLVTAILPPTHHQIQRSRQQRSQGRPAGWKLTGAWPVVSTSAPTTVADIKSVAYGVTITEGMSLGIDLPESVLSASFDVSFSWSKTDTQGTSSGISCPAGEYTCGMSSLAHFIDVNSTVSKDYDTTVSQCTKSGDLGNDNPFAFQAPYRIGEDGDGQIVFRMHLFQQQESARDP